MRISQSSAATNTGRKRRHNEDSFVCEPPIFAVADGMGGARAGELASSLAAGALRDVELDPGESADTLVVGLIQTANRRVHERALSDTAASGMGTTMTVALFLAEGSVVIGHVGDSRAYVLRDGRLDQLTEDHSLVAELVRRGELSPEQAEVHPQRSVITRALGTEPEVDIDAFSVEAKDGDVFLLCSDGLTTMVDPAVIAELVQQHRLELEAASRALIRAANDRGGEDNITTVLFAVAADAVATVGEHELAVASHLDDEDTLHPGDEDTLHPEDAVALPPMPSAFLTMVGMAPAPAPAETAPLLAEDPPAPPASRVRLVLALLVIAALAALVVLLVARGFAQ
jgi:serine/threonine protein phosphatase PrpC